MSRDIFDRFRNRLGSLLQRPVTLEIDGRRHVFRGADDFEAVLRNRTDVSPEILRGLGRRSEHELRQELRDVGEVHRRLMNRMLRVMEGDGNYLSLWDDLDISSLPEDHHWQSLLFALGDEEHVADEFRRVAVVKYLQYLSARREVIEGLCREVRRQPGESEAGEAEDDITIRRLPDVVRLPKDELIRIVFPETRDVQLFFGRRPVTFRLDMDHLMVRDTGGRWHDLTAGRHLLGRSRECDVVFVSSEAEIADISRRHLEVEFDSDGEVRMRDLSSRGTFVPRRLLPGELSSRAGVLP